MLAPRVRVLCSGAAGAAVCLQEAALLLLFAAQQHTPALHKNGVSPDAGWEQLWFIYLYVHMEEEIHYRLVF